MKPMLSYAAACSKHWMRNACEALVFNGLKQKIAELKAKTGDMPEDEEQRVQILREFFEIPEPIKAAELPEMSLYAQLIRLSSVFYFWSRNANKLASNTELKTWIEQGNVTINGYVSKDPHEILDYPVVSLVLFKGAKTQLTLF